MHEVQHHSENEKWPCSILSYRIAALVATGSSAVDEKAQCSLGEQHQGGAVQQEKRPCSNGAMQLTTGMCATGLGFSEIPDEASSSWAIESL